MDSQFYRDLRAPFMTVAPAAVTLAATNKALFTVAAVPAMGKDYWWAGKTVEHRAFGQITTAATPGNLTVALLYGTGADNTGVSLAATAALTLIASQTNISWEIVLRTRCITVGATGTLFTTGRMQIGTAVVAVGTVLIPASAPAVSGSCDLTVAGNILSLQALRSGSTAETMQVVDLQVEALN
jgi:hypothetical protein